MGTLPETTFPNAAAAGSSGVKESVVLRSPAFPEKLPEKNVRQDFLEPDDFERVLPYLPAPLDEVARFANVTGWRLGMILRLTWEMVDRTGGEIRLPDSKNDEPVSVPLDEELSALIARSWQARQFASPEGASLASHIFHREGRPLFDRVCQKQWRRACRKAGLADSTKLHGFRRTAARNMVRAGVPETVAMKITGHKTRSMFDRYNITSADDKLKALRAARSYAEGRKAERLAERNVTEFSR